jgi:hypothetical protein
MQTMPTDQLRELVDAALRLLAQRQPALIGVAIDNTAGVYSEIELLRRLHACLAELDPGGAFDWEFELTALDRAWTEGQVDPEEADDFVTRLEDAINDQLLDVPYLYFGTSDHEPGLWGFWPALESLEEDADLQGSGLIKTSDLPQFLAHVNDHGNVTLYRVHLEEVWSVV